MPGRHKIVMTCAPLRLSFAGGGTDMPAYFEVEDGAVLSTAIDSYVYVTVKRHNDIFSERYRLNYYESEHTSDLEEIRNDIIRECLRLVPLDMPVYVSTVADLPSSSGLGSSGTFAVALLHALHIMRGERVPLIQLAEEACHIEIGALGLPVGKQDQYAAAFGGLNYIRFHKGGRTSIEPQRVSMEKVKAIFDHLMLFWTGTMRSAREILGEQQAAIPGKMANLRAMKGHCDALHDLFNHNGGFDPRQIGAILDETWRMKRDMATTISSQEIDNWYDLAMKAGATGGKIAGAGGGGFLMLVVPLENQNAVRQALSGLRQIQVGYEAVGTRALFPADY